MGCMFLGKCAQAVREALVLHSWFWFLGSPQISPSPGLPDERPSAPVGSPLHNESTSVPYNHGNEYANIITLIGSYSSLCSRSTENSELLIEKQRNCGP